MAEALQRMTTVASSRIKPQVTVVLIPDIDTISHPKQQSMAMITTTVKLFTAEQATSS